MPNSLIWESLAKLHLRGTVNLHKYVDNLVAFFEGHRQLKSLHLAIVSSLRPLGPPPNVLSEIIGQILGFKLCTELVEQIMTRAHMDADGHERSLLRNVHAELEKSTDDEMAKAMRQDVVTALRVLLGYKLDVYTLNLERIRISLKNLS